MASAINVSMRILTNFKGRLFLILVSVCAISMRSAVSQPASHLASGDYEGGRLIVQRAPNFSWECAVRLQIDGRTVANVVKGRRYDRFVPGHHVLTATAVPNYAFRQPASISLNVLSAQTYVFTATWKSDRVVLRRSTLTIAELLYSQPFAENPKQTVGEDDTHES
jgi:hypothetical protein